MQKKQWFWRNDSVNYSYGEIMNIPKIFNGTHVHIAYLFHTIKHTLKEFDENPLHPDEVVLFEKEV